MLPFQLGIFIAFLIRCMNIIIARFRLRPSISLHLTSLASHHANSLLRRRFCASSYLFAVVGNATTSTQSAKGKLKSNGGSRAVAEPERTYLEEMLMEKEAEPKTAGQKVKRAMETTFYISFGFISVVVLGVMTFLVFKEFFAFSTPQGVYRDAVKRVKSDEQCRDLFGKRMLTFGEESGRGRRRHILHNKYVKDGQERLSIMFHVKGDEQIGRVYAEIAKGAGGCWDYRYLLAETDGFPKKTLLLVDNRNIN